MDFDLDQLNTSNRPVALVTGASKGLGLALARALAHRGWRLVVDARDSDALERAAAQLSLHATQRSDVVAIAGSVADPAHRRDLVAATNHFGRLDLLVNNASTLGATPLPPLAGYPLDELEGVYQVDVLAPLGLAQLVLPQLRTTYGTILNISSDTAVEPYEGWGGYGSAKAALDQLSRVLAAEEPTVHVYAIDPGDMRTEMHQKAFPGEDISDRPDPATVVPALLRLLGEPVEEGQDHEHIGVRRVPSGRYRAADLGFFDVNREVPA